MIPKPGTLAEISRLIGDITLTMKATDYLELPPLRVIDERVTLSPRTRKLYDLFEKERVMEIDTNAVTAASAVVLMTKLTQFCNGAVYDDDKEVREIHTEKLNHLLEMIEACQSPVLVYYQFKHDASRILKAISRNLKAVVYEKPIHLDAWNRGEIDVLLAHPASTAYGLNMQAGGHFIIWYGCGWDLEQYQQANARLYRQGQQHPVTVYRLIARETVEERALDLLDGKNQRQQALLSTLKALRLKHGKE